MSGGNKYIVTIPYYTFCHNTLLHFLLKSTIVKNSSMCRVVFKKKNKDTAMQHEMDGPQVDKTLKYGV